MVARSIFRMDSTDTPFASPLGGTLPHGRPSVESMRKMRNLSRVGHILVIERWSYRTRGDTATLDSDLANLYKVPTRAREART